MKLKKNLKKKKKKNGDVLVIVVTVFERGQALVGDLELKGVEKRGWVVQNGDVCDVHGAHSLDPEYE